MHLHVSHFRLSTSTKVPQRILGTKVLISDQSSAISNDATNWIECGVITEMNTYATTSTEVGDHTYTITCSHMIIARKLRLYDDVKVVLESGKKDNHVIMLISEVNAYGYQIGKQSLISVKCLSVCYVSLHVRCCMEPLAAVLVVNCTTRSSACIEWGSCSF